MSEKLSKSITWGIIITSLAIAIIALYILFIFSESPQGSKENQDNALAAVGGDFELIDQDGKNFNSDRLKGKLSLIYFGFTYCPDVCPESLNKISKVLNILEKYNIEINTVFITIDPNRDTQSLMKDYLKHFHNKIIGLTGNPEVIKDVADKFKVYYSINKSTSSNENDYMIDHTTFVYLLDKKGKYLKHFYINSSPEYIIECIRENK